METTHGDPQRLPARRLLTTHRDPWRPPTETCGDYPWRPAETHGDYPQRPTETHGDYLWRPLVETTHRDHPQRPVETTRGDPWRPAETTHGDLWRHLEFDWLIFPTTFNDIIDTDFDWLIFPTTTCGDPRRPPAETSRIWLVNIPHHIQWHHWHRFWLVNIPTTFNDIIGTDFDWLISPPQPIRSLGLNNLINIKSWFFPRHLFEKSTRSQNRWISWL